MDAGAADALIPGGEEEGVGVPPGDRPSDGEILLQRRLAGLVEIEDADLAALTQDPQRLTLDIASIQPNQLRDPESTVQKQRQDAVIPLLIGAIHRA